MIKKITHSLVTFLLNKTLRNYKNEYNHKLPFIAVFGSVGKSSQTQLIAQLFKKNNYKVLSSKKNTINGLGMLLGDFDMSFEGTFGFINKIKFVFILLKKIFFFKMDLPFKSAIIMEIGFDHQGECEDFRDILTNNLDIAVITALTDEHNLNYSQTFDQSSFDKIYGFIPHHLVDQLNNSSIHGDTKNVILEMLKPLEYSKYFYVAADIDKLTNDFFEGDKTSSSINSSEFKIQNGKYYLNDLEIDDKYLIPPTFAKTLQVVAQIGRIYNLDTEYTIALFKDLELPSGRFSKLQGKNNTTIIDSSYNSDPDSVLGFFMSLNQELENQKGGEFDLVRHNIILGEMRELGDIAVEKHILILTHLIALKNKHLDKIENIILLGSEWLKCDEMKVPKVEGSINIVAYGGTNFNCYSKAGDIARYYEDKIRPMSWFWIKGSQNTIFLEILIEKLLAKPEDKKLLCRQETRWFQARKNYE
jgi:UDP-N-acetylmuramyl pentapeptide synthase